MNLQEISNAFGEVVKAVSPHVVRIEARRRIPASGVVLGDGLIATAHHVIRKEKGITIGLEGGETASADLVGRDPTTDLAILKTDATLAKFPIAAEVGSVGNLVLAIGRPGQNVRASFGIIGAVGGAWQTGMGSTIDHYIENDLVMYPGFSGGALINAAGEMIGLNTSALVRGASLTIPAATVARVAAMIVEHGGIRRGFLGISTQTAKLPTALSEQIGQKTGLLIVSVESGSPADDAGLVLGDTIVAFANSPIRDHDDLLANLTADRIGTKSAVSIVRGGNLQSVDVTLGAKQ
jgi:S1-C subfamily serine protease